MKRTQNNEEYDIKSINKAKKRIKNEEINVKIEIYEDTKVLNVKINKK